MTLPPPRFAGLARPARSAFAPLCAASALLLALLAACGTPTQSLSLSLSPAETLQLRAWVPEALRFNVELDPVRGGAATSRWWGSKLSALALEEALDDTLRSVGMLVPARGMPVGYRLRVEIVSLTQPLLGTPDATVTATLQYTLIDKARDGAVLYERAVRTAHTAGLGDALFSAPERMRLANEAAVRASLGVALRDIVVLQLPAPARLTAPARPPPPPPPVRVTTPDVAAPVAGRVPG